MEIQYSSDLHLEFYDDKSLPYEQFLTPVAPYLVLAGDIGIPDLKGYGLFLEWCSSRWTKIFVVAGNHEYYTSKTPVKLDLEAKEAKIRSLCESLPNVQFLQCDSVLLPEYGIRVLGCTLWSSVPDSVKEKAMMYMNDSRQILVSGTQRFTPWDMTSLHERHRLWLDEEIQKCEQNKERCLVVTHYLPSDSLIAEKYQGHPLNSCFASDCEDLMRPPVVGWICGHSHTGVQRTIQGVMCVMNPYGYPGEDVETRSKTAVLRL